MTTKTRKFSFEDLLKHGVGLMWWKIVLIIFITTDAYAGITLKMSSPLESKKVIKEFEEMLPEITRVVDEYGKLGVNMLRQGETKSHEEKLGDLRVKAEGFCKGHCGPKDFGAVPAEDQQVAYLDYVLLKEIRSKIYVKVLEVINVVGKDKEEAIRMVTELDRAISDMTKKINGSTPLYHVPENKMLEKYIKTRADGIEYMNQLIMKDVIGHIEPHGHLRLKNFLGSVGVYFPPFDRREKRIKWQSSRYKPTLFLLFGFEIPTSEEDALAIMESPQFVKKKKMMVQKYHPNTTQLPDKIAKRHWSMINSAITHINYKVKRFRDKSVMGTLQQDPVLNAKRVNDMLWIDSEYKGGMLEHMVDVDGPMFVPPGAVVRMGSWRVD